MSVLGGLAISIGLVASATLLAVAARRIPKRLDAWLDARMDERNWQ